jgi:hypothetical protein
MVSLAHLMHSQAKYALNHTGNNLTRASDHALSLKYERISISVSVSISKYGPSSDLVSILLLIYTLSR